MPRLSLLFATRYLFSKRSHSVINIISGVSSFAVAIPVMAMVILLSVFNGFDSLIKGMYEKFDPDLEISAVQGKTFDISDAPYQKLKQVNGVEQLSYILEDNVMFEYGDRQSIGIIRGVDSLFSDVIPLNETVVQGQFRLMFGDMPEIIVGQGLAYTLGVNPSLSTPFSAYSPRQGAVNPLLPFNNYRKSTLFPSGVFALEAEVDSQYAIAPINFVSELLGAPGRASAVAVKLKPDADPQKTAQAITTILGDKFKVLSRYEQRENLYRIMIYEKWGIYFIILLVLVIASFSLIGSLVMIIIDKGKDIKTLLTMGADINLIRRIFITEGVIIYSIGGVIGMILGVTISLLQQHFGFIEISAQTFLVDAYPVKVRLTDLIWVGATFISVSYLISMFTTISMLPRKKAIIN